MASQRAWTRGVAGIVLGSLAWASGVQACGLDGIPSLSVNGILAQQMTSKPDRAHLAQWAPFIFKTPYRAGRAVSMSENRTELHRSLPAQAFTHPWRWSFGDGSSAVGFSVRHVYHRAGDYRVTVTAYYASYGAWYEFDNALLRVRG